MLPLQLSEAPFFSKPWGEASAQALRRLRRGPGLWGGGLKTFRAACYGGLLVSSSDEPAVSVAGIQVGAGTGSAHAEAFTARSNARVKHASCFRFPVSGPCGLVLRPGQSMVSGS